MASEFIDGWGDEFNHTPQKPKNEYQKKVDLHQAMIDSYDNYIVTSDIEKLKQHNNIAYHQSEINEVIKRHPEYFI